MLEYVKKLITPDMVSLWVPSGQNRAMDLIRGNHGQCYGTHPNVAVLASLLNSSLGWHFDGTDDYVDIPDSNSLDLGSIFSLSAWVKLEGLDKYQEIFNKASGSTAHTIPYRFFITDANKVQFSTDNGTATSSITSASGLQGNMWHYIVCVADGTNLNLYINAVAETPTSETYPPNSNDAILTIGRWGSDGGVYYPFDGYIALPFVANKAWSQQQVNNFYLATKGLFSPRG